MGNEAGRKRLIEVIEVSSSSKRGTYEAVAYGKRSTDLVSSSSKRGTYEAGELTSAGKRRKRAATEAE